LPSNKEQDEDTEYFHEKQIKNKRKGANTEQKKIHSALMRSLMALSTNELDTNYHDLFNEVKNKYLPENGWLVSLPCDLEKTPNRFLKPTLNMAQCLESEGLHVFQSMPLRTSCIPKNFPIDTGALIYLMDYAGIKKQDLKHNTPHCKWMAWNHYFKLDKKVFDQKDYEFFYSIDTDGFCCTLKFVREGYDYDRYRKKAPKTTWSPPKISSLSKEERESLAKKNIVGCDPGKWNLVQMVGDNKSKLRYTTPYRWSESKFTRHGLIRRLMSQANGIKQLELPLNVVNSSTVKLDEFKKYIKIKAEVSILVEGYYNDMVYRKLNHRSKIRGKATTKKFINNIEKTFGSDAVMAYGDWCRSDQMKGIVPTPGISLKKEIARKFAMYDMDEYGSSKYHYDGKELKHHYVNGKKLYRVLVHDERSGPQDKKKVRFIHRDINGARNIRYIAQCEIEGKPHPFRPIKHSAPSSKTLKVTKIIKKLT